MDVFEAITEGDSAEFDKRVGDCEKDHADDLQRTLLWHAAQANQPAMARVLLDKGFDPNAKDCNGWTPLFIAAEQKAISVMKLLLDAGAEVDARCDVGRTALFMATDLNVAKILTDAGADVKVADKEGWTPLHVAAQHGKIPLAKLYLARGADVNAANKNGRQAIGSITANRGKMKAFLVEQGADD